MARLYHARGLRQVEIAARLRLSQPRVSRLLAQAEELGVVRKIVDPPPELHRDLEQGLRQAYGISGVHVVDAVDGGDGGVDEQLAVDLGQAAAPLLTGALAALPPGPHTIGFMSWSRTLRALVESMRPVLPVSGHVVEMLGDLGAPTLQQDVAALTRRLAALTGAEPAFLRMPGVVPSPEIREALLRQDPHARAALTLLDRLDLTLLSIGPCTVVAPLRAGDNYFTEEQFDLARRAGAVGQVCLRFLAEDGSHVRTPLDDLVVGVSAEQLQGARSRWAVAGGADKYAVLGAALVGGWVDHLVTDTATATHLLDRAAAAPAADRGIPASAS